MICNECETVAHCTKHGCVPKQPSPVQEPFGYFKAEPFGWTDCAETDEGAIALYEYPAAQRQWVGLNNSERDAIFELHHTRLGGWDHGGDEVMYDKHFEDAVAAIEAKLKEKNT